MWGKVGHFCNIFLGIFGFKVQRIKIEVNKDFENINVELFNNSNTLDLKKNFFAFE